jgi:hypothetical protein
VLCREVAAGCGSATSTGTGTRTETENAAQQDNVWQWYGYNGSATMGAVAFAGVETKWRGEGSPEGLDKRLVESWW